MKKEQLNLAGWCAIGCAVIIMPRIIFACMESFGDAPENQGINALLLLISLALKPLKNPSL